MRKKQKQRSDNRTFRYTFRLTEQENERFLNMLEEANCSKNRSRFIINRIFGWEFKVIKIDKTAENYYTKLNDFHYQFTRIGNNYNQIVRAVNTHFADRRIPGQLWALEKNTMELREISKQVLLLTNEFRNKWLQK